MPNDLERKRQVIKEVIRQAPPEYTQAPAGETVNQTTWWSRLFPSKPKTPKPKDKAPTRLPTRPKLKPLPTTATASGTVKPDFLSAAKVEPAPARPEPTSVEVKAAIKKTEMTKVAGDDFGVNLLSGEYAQAFAPANQKSFLAYSLGGVAILLILTYLGLHLFQTQTTNQVERSRQANAELEGAIASFSDLDKADQILGRKVGVVKELLSAHVSTLAFLEKLESVTIPEVTFLALAAAPAGAVTVTARATSYTTLARQLTVLQERAPWIKEVTVAAAGLARSHQGKEEGVEFDMILKVDPSVFRAAPQP